MLKFNSRATVGCKPRTAVRLPAALSVHWGLEREGLPDKCRAEASQGLGHPRPEPGQRPGELRPLAGWRIWRSVPASRGEGAPS